MSARLDFDADTIQLDLATVSAEAAAIIREVRGFESAALQAWVDPTLTTFERERLFCALLELARVAAAPGLAFLAIERATARHFAAHVDEFEAVRIETAIARDAVRTRA